MRAFIYACIEPQVNFTYVHAGVKCKDPVKSSSKKGPQSRSTTAVSWLDLHPSLQMMLPPDEWKVDIRNWKLEKMSFNGAPTFSFNAVIRISLIFDESNARSFLQQMMEHSSCTYWVTRTSKTAMKRIAYKLEMHCQHFKKAPSKKQSEMAKLAQSKKANKLLTMQVCNKKTRCPSHLNEHVFNIPT